MGAGTKSSESGPYVVISEALANFFGISEREMLQSEVLRRVWEYIEVNHLEVSFVRSAEYVEVCDIYPGTMLFIY